MHFFEDDQPFFMPAEGRVEAVAKVTGAGRYAAEYTLPGVCYAVVVESTVAAGTILKMDTDTAALADGVLAIFTHEKPMLAALANEAKVKELRLGLPVLHTNKVFFKGQPIALVVASSLEEAMYAASLVKASYNTQSFATDFETAQANTPLKPAGKERGSTEAWANAPIKLEAEYRIEAEVHNPMEMHATIAHWPAPDKLLLYDKTQGVNGVQRTLAKLFGLPPEQVEVMAEFVGGGFGAGLRVWSNTVLAALAAQKLNRAVKLVLTRPQMFTLVGYRPHSWQKIRLGAGPDGQLLGMIHDARHSTSTYETFNEGITRITRLIYKLPHLQTNAAVVPLQLSTPTWMRGPGDCTGDFAVETALDELSYLLKTDPVALRLKNISAETDPETGKPWSTNFLPECIATGAEKIGWKNRPMQPQKTSEGPWMLGYGMAVGMWNAGRQQASAGIQLLADGSITVLTAMTDIGTGTGTGMQNIAHEVLGIPKEKIKVSLGNSSLPPAPSQGGSTGLSSMSGAVVAAAQALRKKLLELAAAQNEAFAKAGPDDLMFAGASIALKNNAAATLPLMAIFEKNALKMLEVEASSGPGEERQKYAFCSAAAHFVILRVHKLTGKVKIDRMVCVADGGKIVNDKAAANQISGAAVGGIGMALMEALHVDNRYGAAVNNDLAGYHFAVNADAPIIEVSFIGKPDPNINPSGAKGLGEVGIIGCAAAIGNAIFHATGKRLRHLPFTPDKVLKG